MATEDKRVAFTMRMPKFMAVWLDLRVANTPGRSRTREILEIIAAEQKRDFAQRLSDGRLRRSTNR